MANLLETPRTEIGDRSRFTNLDLSEIQSFIAPAGAGNFMNATRNAGRPSNITTPSIRNPLANRSRNAQSKNEFTPLLKSAAKNRMSKQDNYSKENYGGLVTPAALKPGYNLSSPNIPEPSMYMDTPMSVDDTPLAPGDSSSAMSTPMVLSKRGELGAGGDGGNVLTLREQEAKLEIIDKENFGLKLKVHFLEENLKRSGSEWNQQAIRENTELKTTSVIMERDLKKYKRQMRDAETQLTQYRQQLHEYMENMKKRHVDESLREEMDRLQGLADERGQQLEDLQAQLKGAEGRQADEEELGKLRDDIDDLEAELNEKNQVLEERDDEIDSLKSQMQLSSGQADVELVESDRRFQQQADRIEELEAELQKQSARSEELDTLRNEFNTANRELANELEETRKQAEVAERNKKDQLREFEARVQTWNREKSGELEVAQRKIRALEKDNASQIEHLENRLKVAESLGDNQSQLAQQATQDAHEQLRRVTREKDAEVESLRSQIKAFEGVQDELEICQKQLRDYAEDVKSRHATELEEEERTAKLREDLAESHRELKTLRGRARDHEFSVQETEQLQRTVTERDRKLVALQKIVDEQAASLQDLRQIRSTLADLERRHGSANDEIEQLKAVASDRERQIQTLRKTLEDRNVELEVLRQNNNEPDSQLEGLQSIVRHRDTDLEELRATVNEQDSKLDKVQKLADERYRSLEQLRNEFATTKEDLEDEMRVLESNLDEVERNLEEVEEQKLALESQVTTLEVEIRASFDLQAKLEPLEKDLRAVQREKVRLQKEVESLEKDRDVYDDERISLQTTIDKLRKDLHSVKQTAGDSAELVNLRVQLSEKETAFEVALAEHHHTLQEKTKKHASELKKLHDMLRSSTLEVEELNARASAAEQDASRIPTLEKALADKNRQVRDYDAENTKRLHSRAQEAREEAGRLRVEIMDKEKSHAKELRGLATQIQFLHSFVKRESQFRESLGWQKKWFLLNVEMYNACNQADLRLIEEMGITPKREIRDQRPTLRTVAQMVIFCSRARKLSDGWAEKRKIQESLMRKLDIMHGKRKGRNVVRQGN